MSSLLARSQKIISDFRPFHSEFQLDNIVIGASGFGDDSDETAYGTWLQLQREIQSRISALRSQHVHVQKLRLELLDADAQASRWLCLTRRQRAKREIAKQDLQRIQFELGQRQFEAADIARELEVLTSRAECLASRVRSWSADETQRIELVWWMRRYERRLQAAAMYQGAAAEVFEFLLDLPQATRRSFREIALERKIADDVPRLLSALEALEYGSHHREHLPAHPNPIAIEGPRIHGSLPRAALAY